MSSPFSPAAYPGITSPEITCKITTLPFILTATPLVPFLLTAIKTHTKKCQQNRNKILICLKHLLIYRAFSYLNLDQLQGKAVEGWVSGVQSDDIVFLPHERRAQNKNLIATWKIKVMILAHLTLWTEKYISITPT